MYYMICIKKEMTIKHHKQNETVRRVFMPYVSYVDIIAERSWTW